MNFFKYIKILIIIVLSAGILTTASVSIPNAYAEPGLTQAQTNAIQYIQVSPLTVVNSPKTYLNKNIVMNAKFDKFSTLGLDYKPAFKSSEDYISFLIKRDDTTYSIPLSEMKLFIKRDVAEKFIDLKTDDKIQIKGLVFSEALGDTWIDVKELKVIEKTAEEKK